MNGKSYQAYACRLEPEGAQESIPFEITANSERKINLFIPKDARLERDKSVEIDLPVEDGIEKGFSVYLSS